MSKRVMGYIESGKDDGATLHFGGVQHGTEGYYISPTIFTNTKPSMKIVQEEIFGPVGVVVKFSSEEEVLKEANDTQYGLAAAVFTKDMIGLSASQTSSRRGRFGLIVQICWICKFRLEVSNRAASERTRGVRTCEVSISGPSAILNYANIR